jgi:hypothetical protein
VVEFKRPLSAPFFPGLGRAMLSVHVPSLAHGKN